MEIPNRLYYKNDDGTTNPEFMEAIKELSFLNYVGGAWIDEDDGGLYKGWDHFFSYLGKGEQGGTNNIPMGWIEQEGPGVYRGAWEGDEDSEAYLIFFLDPDC